jgi:phosphorylcholine metabolism protein LicD
MRLVQLKLEKDAKFAKYISLIRKFDPTISAGQIKNNIENNLYAVSFDLGYYDVLEDLQGIDRKLVFRCLISQLMSEGAQLSIYVNDELWTLEHLDNWLDTMREISEQREREDMNLYEEEE